MEYYGITDIGKRRNKNQDRYFIGEIHGYHVSLIADGMGGHLSGEVASKITVDRFIESAKEELSSNPPVVDFVESTIEKINEDIYGKSKQNPEMQGMGTTIVLSIVKDGIAHIFHIGDSRGYLWKDESLQLITQDHSLINELKKQNRYNQEEELNIRHIITRSLGTDEKVQADYTRVKLEDGNYILLCTDGLSDDVSSSEIEKVLLGDTSVKEKVQQLLNKALNVGGKDNITICLMRYEE